MDYSNKILLRDYLEKMDKIYQKQAVQSKQYRLLFSLLYTNPIMELYDFPELFSSEGEYDKFFEGKSPEKMEKHDFDKLEQMLYVMLFSQAGKYPLRTSMASSFEDNLAYGQMRQDLAEHQAKSLRSFSEKQQQRWTNTHRQEYNSAYISSQLKKQEEQLHSLIEHQMRQRDNALRYTVELNRPKDEQKRYKHWIWTPNPNTRHPLMADTVVPIDEQFHVISTQSKCVDCYMDYPLDISAPACQTRYCKCFPVYTTDRDAL